MFTAETGVTCKVDWLQSPVTKYFFLIILFDNPLELNQNKIMTKKAGH